MKDLENATDFNFKVGSKVFYPPHGAGSIKTEKNIEFQGEKKKYFEFQFIDAQLTVSTPVENVNRLGVRPVLSPKEIKDAVKILKTKPTKKPKGKEYNDLINEIQDIEVVGEVESYIIAIQMCNHVRKQREKEGRLIPVSITKLIKSSVNHLIAELAVSSDQDLEKTAEQFEKITGISV